MAQTLYLLVQTLGLSSRGPAHARERPTLRTVRNTQGERHTSIRRRDTFQHRRLPTVHRRQAALEGGDDVVRIGDAFTVGTHGLCYHLQRRPHGDRPPGPTTRRERSML